ncbi:hypothetical protein M427DRAFT_221193 [Gonapodya prolifera JEL478]|uniref:Uncharacterized protein n=1 Tax=Gonapodya prolifera (strain JEL478) TaxID=1344416 RepID=A0A139AMS4_GONPJ|nr:hypothetical protein M427DRAFT_221193 [Gonapodya prolifera JEL478]|eukprot:KXS18061.1 hypothetical protein M427DRAFT_221193 [Gonapodya prolifera JEL478]
MTRLRKELEVVHTASISKEVPFNDFISSLQVATFLPIVQQLAIPNWFGFKPHVELFWSAKARPGGDGEYAPGSEEGDSLGSEEGNSVGSEEDDGLSPREEDAVCYLYTLLCGAWSRQGRLSKTFLALLDYKNQHLKQNKRKRPDGQIGKVAFKEAKHFFHPLVEKEHDEYKLLFEEALPLILWTIRICQGQTNYHSL